MVVSVLGGVLVVGLLAVVVATVVAGRQTQRQITKARADQSDAKAKGALPPSLHPKIDPDRCIGSGSCVTVCPETDVLAVLDGRAEVVNPTSCIGHGECLRACPVDAIALVLGNERRGVDIPMVAADFQTNVPGLYVVGELGGMGLVHNAMTQALQCVEGLRRQVPAAQAGVHQLIIVGAGPAGLAAGLAAKEAGLDFVVLEQHSLGGSVLHYPRHKIVMTRPVKLPLYGSLQLGEVRKEALLETWHDIQARAELPLRAGVRVDAVTREADETFRVTTSEGEFCAHRLMLAMGRRGTPRKLGVPGEEQGKVVYRLIEPEAYRGLRCVVVGGGDAGVEAAITLGEVGAAVHLAHRKGVFDRIKRKNQERLDAAVAAGTVTVLIHTTVSAIGKATIDLSVNGAPQTLDNDHVLIFAGGVLPTDFLTQAGVEISTYRGEAYAPANL
ncbi:MAG: NAD(P)-binding domain-containing protein [Myxococcota bacterium]